LQDVGEVRAGHDLLATGAEGVEREELLGGAEGGEADASDLAGDEAFGFEELVGGDGGTIQAK
jgi:hypothetical protein